MLSSGSFHAGFSLASAAVACAILVMITGLDPSSMTMSDFAILLLFYNVHCPNVLSATKRA